MATTTTTEFRTHISDYLGRAQYGGERITVTQHGQPVAALISIQDLELLRAIEDRMDIAAADAALREAAEVGFVPLSDLDADDDA